MEAKVGRESNRQGHVQFCKELMGLSNCTANRIAEMELGGDSRKGKAWK
jgi:hypothetical protein